MGDPVTAETLESLINATGDALGACCRVHRCAVAPLSFPPKHGCPEVHASSPPPTLFLFVNSFYAAPVDLALAAIELTKPGKLSPRHQGDGGIGHGAYVLEPNEIKKNVNSNRSLLSPKLKIGSILMTGLPDFNNQAYASAKCIGALYIVRSVAWRNLKGKRCPVSSA